ncbi:hypothetical protein [Streptomyces cyslabdanicus]
MRMQPLADVELLIDTRRFDDVRIRLRVRSRLERLAYQLTA